MSEPNVLESLPDDPLSESDVEKVGDADAVEWTEPLDVGSNPRLGIVGSWILETDDRAHVLFYGMDGWVSRGTFDPSGMTAEEKRERGHQILDV
ncbi:hypothetical protein [Halorussus halobius]|uniref:hypothetical protein n=1 Tax=Halorussus halobius TaxID=1710537 RepID=UPI00109335A3|nr:hypothetical protein [Halorussus halobius]